MATLAFMALASFEKNYTIDSRIMSSGNPGQGMLRCAFHNFRKRFSTFSTTFSTCYVYPQIMIAI